MSDAERPFIKTYKRIAKPSGDVVVFEIPHHYAIRPHKEAPAFPNFASAQTTIVDMMNDIASGSFMLSRDTLDLWRQLGLVNLWFFLKVIAGSSGPYSEINDDVNLDMCNWRQSDSCMGEGARWIALMPRGFRKSTIFSHGANTWELTRDGNQRIRLVNAIISRAEDFKHLSQRTIDSNPFYAALYGNAGFVDKNGRAYPCRVPLIGGKHWNEEEMVMPTREKFAIEPSIKSGGVTGAGEGDHHSLLNIDDPVGLDAIDWQYQSTVMMENAKKWMNTNLNALLVSPIRDRVGVVGTRYGEDDCYKKFVGDAKEVIGSNDEDLVPVPDGKWSVYYRTVRENGKIILPEVIDEKTLANMDPWTRALQYENKPRNAGLNEFIKYETKQARLIYDESNARMLVSFFDDEQQRATTMNLGGLTGVISVDPASTDEHIRLTTSRTSVGVTFMDSRNRAFRVWNKVGYLGMADTFDYIFEAWRAFPGLITATLFETNAMQKGLYQLLEKEQEERRTYINLQPVTSKGDKKARIRSVVGWYYAQGLVYATPEASFELNQEKDAFPSPKLDVLDEFEKSLSWISRPATDEEVLIAEEAELEHSLTLSDNLFGY